MKGRTTVSLAHTNADYDTAMAAFAAGAGHAVHLYNAMPPFTHRAPGVIGAVMDSPHVDAELICDGVHIHPSAVRAAFRMLGADRIVFISDSMRATACRRTLHARRFGRRCDRQPRGAGLGRRAGRFGHQPARLHAHSCPGNGRPAGGMRWPAPRSIPRAALASTTGTAPSVPGAKRPTFCCWTRN